MRYLMLAATLALGGCSCGLNFMSGSAGGISCRAPAPDPGPTARDEWTVVPDGRGGTVYCRPDGTGCIDERALRERARAPGAAPVLIVPPQR